MISGPPKDEILDKVSVPEGNAPSFPNLGERRSAPLHYSFPDSHAVNWQLLVPLLRACRTNIAALGRVLFLNHAERHPGSCRGYATVDGGRDCDQRVEFVVRQSGVAGLFNPVSRTNLAAAGHRHGQADQMFLTVAQEFRRMGLFNVIYDQLVVVRHVF